jgi:hypothetical protein
MNEPDIRQFKLMNGESIIAYVNKEDDSGFMLEIPFEIHKNSENNTAEFSLWMHMTDFTNNVYVQKCNIIGYGDANSVFKYQYIQMMTRLTEDDYDNPPAVIELNDDSTEEEREEICVRPQGGPTVH